MDQLPLTPALLLRYLDEKTTIAEGGDEGEA
jgi:hypothetical protein